MKRLLHAAQTKGFSWAALIWALRRSLHAKRAAQCAHVYGAAEGEEGGSDSAGGAVSYDAVLGASEGARREGGGSSG